MTLREYLFHLELHGIKLGLDNIQHLLDAAARPERAYPAVHVAGTNGKGSVVAIVAAIARAAGYRTGRFTSPHLIDVAERFLVDGAPMPGDALDENIAFFRAVAEKMQPPPTFFEMNTAIAFRWFAQSAVDIAIVEVGMGGRLDSTNVLSPAATAITNIALDHTKYLGDTLEQIAVEKAGIIKPGVPLVLTETMPPACEAIVARAKELGSPVSELGRDFQFRITGPPFDQRFSYESASLRLDSAPFALAGRHQGVNAAAGVALAGLLAREFPRIDEAAIAEGLRSVQWPCRLERVLDAPPVIIDVAHNPAGARTVADALEHCVTLLAVSSDKDAAGIVEALAPITEEFVLSQYSGARSLDAAALTAFMAGRPCRALPALPDAIEYALTRANNFTPLLITGSIFAAGEARRHLIARHGARPLSF